MPHQWCHISVMAPHWELVCLFVQQLILLGKYQSSAWLGVLRWPETPLTKGQWWGKCFRIMTLSCANFKHHSTFELSWACLYRTYFIYTILGQSCYLKFNLIKCECCSHVLWWFCTCCLTRHDDVIKWKHSPRPWPFVRGIHRSPVNSPHKGQGRGALMFSLICAWINGWVNNRKAPIMRSV